MSDSCLNQDPFFHQAAPHISENKEYCFISFFLFFFLTYWGVGDIVCICCAVSEEVSVFFRAYVRSSSTHMKLSEDFVICSHSSLKRVLEL